MKWFQNGCDSYVQWAKLSPIPAYTHPSRWRFLMWRRKQLWLKSCVDTGLICNDKNGGKSKAHNSSSFSSEALRVQRGDKTCCHNGDKLISPKQRSCYRIVIVNIVTAAQQLWSEVNGQENSLPPRRTCCSHFRIVANSSWLASAEGIRCSCFLHLL